MGKLKIWHISDTHDNHDLLRIPEGIDMIIHSGDFTNYKDLVRNKKEAIRFLEWYGAISVKYKLLIAGNHDAFPAMEKEEFVRICNEKGIIYLEDDFVRIEGFNFYGSPATPTYGEWYFMKNRHKIDEVWQKIPIDTDVLITHGPSKGTLDLSYNPYNVLEMAGCSALRRHILSRLHLKYSLFGHIHNDHDIINAGVLKLSNCDTIFSNGSVVTDGKMGQVSSNGNLLEL